MRSHRRAFGAVLASWSRERDGADAAGPACRHESLGTVCPRHRSSRSRSVEVITFDAGARVQRGMVDTSPQNAERHARRRRSDQGASSCRRRARRWWRLGQHDFTFAQLTRRTTSRSATRPRARTWAWQVVELPAPRCGAGGVARDLETTKTVTIEAARRTHPARDPRRTQRDQHGRTPRDGASGGQIRRRSRSAACRAAPRSKSRTRRSRSRRRGAPHDGVRGVREDEGAGGAGLGAETSVAFSTMQAVSGQSTGSTAYADR